jgi:hypothetical protein
MINWRSVSCLVRWLTLGLYEEIYNTRAPYTWLVHVSHALENIDYLTNLDTLEALEYNFIANPLTYISY